MQFGLEAAMFILTPVSVIAVPVHVLLGKIQEGSLLLFLVCALDFITKRSEAGRNTYKSERDCLQQVGYRS